MKKQNNLRALLPYLDDAGQNDLLAVIDAYIETKRRYPDITASERINRMESVRYDIIKATR